MKTLLYSFICSLYIIVVGVAYAETSSIKGKVLDDKGYPVKNAEVFCEQGLMEPLNRVITNEDGQFEFINLKEGPTGIFATTQNKAWSGIHINLPVEEHITDLEIILGPGQTFKGKVVALNEKGKEEPVSGAEIERFAILGEEKVAIPCSKLTPFGYDKVISDKDGFFILDKIPLGRSLSLKAIHPEYAVTTVDNVSPSQEIKVILSKGCVVLGSVFTTQNNTNVKVANAEVIIKNSQPPYESVYTKTNNNGEFTIRLNPGIYLCKAETSQLLSAGWVIAKIANSMGEHIQIPVFPSVFISGQIMDAVSGEPVAGAKVSIEQGGKKSLSLITGKMGKFRGKVAHGQALVRFEGIPGYSLPQPPQLNVVVSGKDEIVLPGVWVKRIEGLKIKVTTNNQNELKTKRCILSILNPTQLGWYAGDIENLFEIKLSSYPTEGMIVGYAEIPDENRGNVFFIDKKDTGKTCEVQLHPLGSLRGHIVDKEGKPITDIVASCYIKENLTQREYLLWQVLTSNDGVFYWNSVITTNPLIIKLYGNDGTLLWQSHEMLLSAGEQKDMGDIVLDKVPVNNEELKEAFFIKNYKNLCGGEEIINDANKRPFLLVFAEREEIPLMQEVLLNVKNILGGNLQVGIITNKEIDCSDMNIPVILGKQPSPATTILIDDTGKVVCKTIGLPILARMIQH